MVTRMSVDKYEEEDGSAVVSAAANAVMSEDFDDEGDGVYRPPRFKLLQSNSPEVSDGDSKAGTYYGSAFGEMGREVAVIPVQSGRYRIFNDPREEMGDAVCQSADAVTGEIEEDTDFPDRDQITGNCKTCPFAQWGKRDPKTKKQTKPACTLFRAMLVYLPEEDSLARIDFSGTGMSAAESMMQRIRVKKAWGVTAFRLGSTEARFGNTTYRKPSVKMVKEDEQVKAWLEAAAEAVVDARSLVAA